MPHVIPHVAVVDNLSFLHSVAKIHIFTLFGAALFALHISIVRVIPRMIWFTKIWTALVGTPTLLDTGYRLVRTPIIMALISLQCIES